MLDIVAREVHVQNWEDLARQSDEFHGSDDPWIFRGQREQAWGLTTSLHRTLRDFEVKAEDAERTEVGLVCRFRRQAHHYVGSLAPERHQVVEWLALMQHFGAPTRMQDWTYSFLIAVFFAVESASGASAVWAMRRKPLVAALRAKLPGPLIDALERDGYADTAESFTQMFARSPAVPLVCPVNPYRLNERLSIQQGLFLVPGDVKVSFQDNLDASLAAAEGTADLTRVVLPASAAFRADVLARLQSMNISAATLFPGLDGFARSLRTLVAARSIIPSPKDWSRELR